MSTALLENSTTTTTTTTPSTDDNDVNNNTTHHHHDDDKLPSTTNETTSTITTTTTNNNNNNIENTNNNNSTDTNNNNNNNAATLYGVSLEALGAVEEEVESDEDEHTNISTSNNNNTTTTTSNNNNNSNVKNGNNKNSTSSPSTPQTAAKNHTSSFASKLFNRFRTNSSSSHEKQHSTTTSNNSNNINTASSHSNGGEEPPSIETKIDADEKRYKETPMIFSLPTKKSSGSAERGLSTVASNSHISKTGKLPSQQQLFVETNLEDYLFSFQGIFTDRTLFRAFYRYLETEHNTEPLEFITRVNELEFTYYKMMKMVKDIQMANANLALDSSTVASSASNSGSAGSSSAAFSHFKTPFSDLPKMMLMMTQNDKTKSSPSKSESEPTTPRKAAKKQLSFFGLGKKKQLDETKTAPLQQQTNGTPNSHDMEDDESSEKSGNRFSLRLSILKKKKEQQHNQQETTTISNPNSNANSNVNTPHSNPTSPSEKQESTLMELILKDVPTVVTKETTTTEPTTTSTSATETGTETTGTATATTTAATESSFTNNPQATTNGTLDPTISLTTPTPRTLPKLNLGLVEKSESGDSEDSTPVGGGGGASSNSGQEDNAVGMKSLLTVLTEKKEKKKEELKNGVTSPEDDPTSERSDISGSSTRTSGDRPRSLQHAFLTLPPNTPRSKYDQVLKVYRKQIMLAIQIMKDFIEEDSKKEINISSRDKRTFVGLFQESKQYQNFDEWMLPQPPHLLFRTMKNSVMYELENDSFPRFVRSDLWFKKLQHKGLSYLTKVGRLKEATYYPYGDDDFRLPYVFDRDIEFMEYLARDDYQWKLLGSKKEGAINVYKLSEKVLFPNVGFYQKMQINKWTGILPYPFDAVKKCCMPGLQVHKYDPNISSCEELSFYDFETLKKMYPNEKFKRGPRSCGVIRYGVCFPFPFTTKRSFLSVCTSYYDKNEEKLTLLYKPCEHERYYMNGKGVNEGKKLIDIRDFQYYSIKKLDSYRTNITQIHLLDVGGNARFAINLLRMDRAKGMMKGFNDYIRKNINSIPVIPEEDPVWKHVISCMGKEAAERVDMSATLYNDLKMGRNIRNKSLAATIKKHKKEKKKKEKKLKRQLEKQQQLEKQTQLGTDLPPTSPLSSTISSCSDDTTSKMLSRQNSTTSFGQSFISPEAILEEEDAMLTLFDADMENFTMTGTTDNDASDEEFDDDDEDDDGEL